MGALHSFLLRLGDSDTPALLAIREVLVQADEWGVVERSRLSLTAQKSVDRLQALGLVEVFSDGAVDDPQADGSSVGWSHLRLTPAARADLIEAEIEGDRASLLHLIDERLEPLPEQGTGPASEIPSSSLGEEPPASAELHEVALVTPAPIAPAAPQQEDAEGTPGGRDEDDAAGAGSSSEEVAAGQPAPIVHSDGGSTLSSRGLIKIYRKRRVVNEVDLYLSQGEIVGLLGPNGAGKTTTFYMVVGLIKPDRGKVYLGSDDVTDVPMYRRARRGIGYLAQEPSIFRKLSVEENVLAVLQMLRLSRREQRERLESLLDELGIKHLRHSKAYALSGGERRRLEITRALVGNPKFMLLDEPFAGVDPIAVHDIQQIVADLRRRGIGVLISDHNVEQTLDIVDRAYIMYDGRVRVSGTVSELVWNDEVAEIYLGPTLTARMRQRYVQPL
jgi:lipopolysaccharide export system ATP-binding protein